MMLGKKTSSDKIDASVARSVNFELTIADLARRSERRAWWIAGAAIVMSLILASGYFYMLPLKQKVPFLVMADAYTGTSAVARLAASPGLGRITASQAINRSNVAHYVLARESYDIALMRLQDWATVLTMSAPGVATAYRSQFSSTNPDNPQKLYGNGQAIRVKILSIVLLGPKGRTPTGATVRFQRSLYDKMGGSTRPLDNKLATLAFTYKPDLKMAEQYRIENPLGFQVTDYRVDNDFDATPPNAVPQPTANATPAPVAGAAALPPSPELTPAAPALGASSDITGAPPPRAQAQPGSATGASHP